MKRGELTHSHCVAPGCGRELVGGYVWRHWTLEQRAAARAEGKMCHHGRGLCSGCYTASRRPTPPEVRPFRRITDVLEDWQDLEDARAGMSRAQAVAALAPRLGMSPAGLERALNRAKANGLVAA